MISNYFKILIRNLWKNKFFTILNMTGLAVGMTCYLLVFKYVSFELSYDDFHQNKKNIYRLQRDIYENDILTISWAKESYNIGPAIKTEFPAVKDVVRTADFPSNIVIYNEKKFRDEKILITEPSFFNVFSFHLLQGNPQTSLAGPNSVVISERAVKKYFNGENPMGKTIRLLNKNGEHICMVNGVFQDVPENSLLKFDFLVSISTFYDASYSDWIFSIFHTYILLNPNAGPQALEDRFPLFINKFILPHVPRAALWKLKLQPFKEIYLHSNINGDTQNGDGKTINFLTIVAFLILVISWINYINLSTARAMERAREVGMRKVLGGKRGQLIRQFLNEAILVNTIPIIAAFLLFIILLPFLRQITGKGIYFSPNDTWFWLNLVSLYFVGSMLSGLYPAFVLSSFKPTTVLKRSKLSQSDSGILLRKILVVFQFAASTVLIIVILTVYRQISYMRSMDLGIVIKNTLVIKLPSTPVDQQYIERTSVFKTELYNYRGAENITGSTSIPGTEPEFRRLCWRENITGKEGKIVSIIFVDYDYFRTFFMKFIVGRNFDQEYGTDLGNAVIINESALKLLGLDPPPGVLNQKIFIYNLGSGSFNIVGVIKDYHHQSLKKNYDPIVFVLNPNIKNFYSIKLNPQYAEESEIINFIKQKWSETFPGYPFDYFFLDDYFDRQYNADKQFGKILSVFVWLAIFITCLGLLGLSYYSTYQRTKEIGIRKSMGANIEDILYLLNRDIVRLVIIAVVLAWPVALYVIVNWLSNYANRISVPIDLFILGGIFMMLIALSTVSYHTLTAARANPVDTLKEE